MAGTEVVPFRLDDCLQALDVACAQPARFLSVQDGLASEFTSLTKALYDFHKQEPAGVKGSPLKELVIENFDEEQIWQQLEIQNGAVLDYFQRAVGENVNDKDLSLLETCGEDKPVLEEGAADSDDEGSGDESDQSSEGTDEKNKSRHRKKASFSSEDSDGDIDFDIDELEKRTQKAKRAALRPAEKSIVDDKFFKLAEMETFLDDMEKDKGGCDRQGDEDEIDYFDDILSDDDEEEQELLKRGKKPIKSSRDLKYKDYFDPVEEEEEEDDDGGGEMVEEEASLGESEAENDDDTEEDDKMEDATGSKNMQESAKRVTFDLSDDSEGEDVGEILGGKEKDTTKPKSSFEKRQEKMTEKIKMLEKKLLEEKSWQLSGEVTGQKRPENSLLEETLLFENASKTAPVITEETTVQLEEIIKQRIKDQAWDDVIRKEKPKENIFEYKKRLTLDHEKSKLSLAEIYEQEYVKRTQQKSEEEENPKHVEIQKAMDTLFLKLDALSNFHFIPKPPVPEVKIVSNLPAISMEDVAPVNISDAALLAPEEVKEKNKAGDVKTDSEKTATDKKRERRRKKHQKGLRLREKLKRQKLLEKTKLGDAQNRYDKQVTSARLKKLTKEGKATLLTDQGKDKALKSSQAFFSQLQDQVRSQIKVTKEAQKKSKKPQELSAHKLKL
ncbi:U3 small nucleolar ribonucleoprotein MPP10 [Microcaecilia unicolor]|uniref:U3 small nucleolar ribonucleoprotein protein MPP10 n=1 Tax=Microcaecilia unicolor TaxID=1415580 RepID=A0A6P7X1G2_9AMPH|nr:U3 small nucleolar ribonucleoprotein protein MPP10 [Microcaecilia unicolor]